MSSQHLCPFCSSPLLCQITDGNLSWYCRHCHLEIPYGICHEIEEGKGISYSIAQNPTKSTLQLLKKTWQKTITEIKEALQADRVMLWQYNHQGELKVLEEALNPDYPSMKDWMVGHFFTKQELTEFTQGKLQIKADLGTGTKDNLLESFFEVKAKLVAPIILPNNHHAMPKLWGLLLVNHCAKAHQWQESEIKLTSIIAKQIGVSIEQSENYQQLKLDYEKVEEANCIDPATGFKNVCQIDDYLQRKWPAMTELQQPISIIVGAIDDFSRYKHILGEQAQVNCLKQIGKVITNVCQTTESLVVKNQTDEFIIILPCVDGAKAVKLAETIRLEIKGLRIESQKPEIAPYLTISLGIASTIPKLQSKANTLLQNAQTALAKGQKNGANCLTFEQYSLDIPENKSIKSNHWEGLSTTEQLRSYISYFLSRGKIIISPVSGPLYFRGLVYEYRGYHSDFVYFWQQLRLRKDFLDLYLQGDRYSFNDFLTGAFCIQECARCSLPIPVPVGSAYDIPHCDLCSTNENIESEYCFKVIAIAQPLAKLLQLQELCAANRILLTCISTPQALTPRLWEDGLDLILINSQISSDLAQKWAERIHKIADLATLPIVALSKQAGNGITAEGDSEQELANYLLNPLSGKHLADHLKEIANHTFLSVPQDHLTWFPT